MRDIIGENGTCQEQKCIISHEGKTFEAGGAFIGIDKHGKHVGCAYGDWEYKKVMNWHGDMVCSAHYGPEYRSNWGDKRRHVWFTWKGIKYHGLWANTEWNQLIRVREIKG